MLIIPAINGKEATTTEGELLGGTLRGQPRTRDNLREIHTQKAVKPYFVRFHGFLMGREVGGKVYDCIGPFWLYIA